MNIEIKIQSTPNPSAYKFILNHDVKTSGKISYKTRAECDHVPLAKTLLEIPGVDQVHLFENVITITHSSDVTIEELGDEIIAAIKNNMPDHDPHFIEHQEEKPKVSLSPEMMQIESILEATVRPYLQGDGGDIELINYDNNILTLRYQGSCGSCPSSMAGTLQAIEQTLRSEFNPDIQVVALDSFDGFSHL